MPIVISVEHLSKAYRLGQIGTGTFRDDLKIWWAKQRGKPNPMLRIGETDHSNRDGDEIWALKDVSFTVEQGKVLGIIGRNGAGKSTLLKLLSRITAPTSGVIRGSGRVASLLEVGTGFHPELTGRENIYLNGAILGMNRREIDRKFDEIVDFSEVEKFIDTPVKRYSSGMYVRLAFAVAAHLEPEILVVDEVLAVGDSEFQKKCLGKMGEVAEEGRTVLFVSHNMVAIEALCRRVIMIESGRLQEDGDANEVIASYLSGGDFSEGEALLELPAKGREGSGKIRFIRWVAKDNLLGMGRSIRTAQPFAFEMEYKTEAGQKLKNVEVAVAIRDVYGKPILTSSTQLLNARFDSIPAHGKFVCHFKSLPLLPNKYQVHLWCEVQGETADRITNAGFIQVVESDLYGTGRMPRKKQGIIVAEGFRWEVGELE